MQRFFEESAGGIVYRKRWGEISILLLERPKTHGGSEYVLPKGHIEPNETAKDAAIREIREETGLDPRDLRIVKFLTKVSYQFVATYQEGTPLIDKDVYLFLVRYTGSRDPSPAPPVKQGEGFLGFRWVTLRELSSFGVKPDDVHTLVEKNLRYM